MSSAGVVRTQSPRLRSRRMAIRLPRDKHSKTLSTAYSSIFASSTSITGMSSRIGYTRWHWTHFKPLWSGLSSTVALHSGHTRISSKSLLIAIASLQFSKGFAPTEKWEFNAETERGGAATKVERRSQSSYDVCFQARIAEERNAMKQFIAKFTDRIDGVLCGFDRLVMRGEMRALYIAKGGGIEQYLRSSHVMFKDFGERVLEVSRRLKEASLAAALELGRVVRYVPSAAASKEDIARQIAAEQKIQSGLVCVLSSVEPCMSFQAVPNRETKKLDFKLEQRKCLHLYHYLIHPVFGFMNARIQTWFPFRVQICLNGREWLARSMDAAGLRYVRQDNCFPWIEDFPAAQRLMDEQLSTNWPEELNR